MNATRLFSQDAYPALSDPIHTKQIKKGALNLYLDPSYDVPQLHEFIDAIRSGDLSRVTQVDSSDYARVYRFELPGVAGNNTFYYKEFLFRSFGDRLSVILRKSRARRAWDGAQLLLANCFLTATPVCMGEERRLGIVKRSFMVTEAVGDAQSVDSFIKKNYPVATDQKSMLMKRKFLQHLGMTVGRMHHLGIFQGDLRPGNVLVQHGDPPTISLIDNERTRKYGKLPVRKRVKNLVQINLSLVPAITRSDRARFFSAYLEENPDLMGNKKKWQEMVLSKTRSRMMLKGWRYPSPNRTTD